MRCLVTGGAGFVGSHVALALSEAGHEVTIIDNLSTGHFDALPFGAQFIALDLAQKEKLADIIAQGWDVVFHFAALSLVGVSMKEPFHYLRDNFNNSLNLIEACALHGVKRFVFSSTAALFGGEERKDPISADALIDANSPYGESKYLIERALIWAERLYGMKSACLRYFNAAGADILGRLGEDHRPETHLIPLAIDTALGRREKLFIFGNDYPTKDGTCVRDYIHVNDLAVAHMMVMEVLEERSVSYNLGNGAGFSTLEVVKTVEKISGRDLPWEFAERREGDPAILVADSSLIMQEIGWKPVHSSLENIIETALKWRLQHSYGYRK